MTSATRARVHISVEKPLARGPFKQCLLHLRQLLVGQLRQPTGPASTGQSALALGEEDPMPARRGLRRNTQRVHHIDLTLAAGEHIRRSLSVAQFAFA